MQHALSFSLVFSSTFRVESRDGAFTITAKQEEKRDFWPGFFLNFCVTFSILV